MGTREFNKVYYYHVRLCGTTATNTGISMSFAQKRHVSYRPLVLLGNVFFLQQVLVPVHFAHVCFDNNANLFRLFMSAD